MLNALVEHFQSPLARLLLQFVVIILATRLAGSLFARLGQPPVIGEITAGILLGPSLLGWLWPGASAFIFPKESLGVLQLISQIGVCVFMFVVGLELDPLLLRQRARAAAVISNVGIVVPFAPGAAGALPLHAQFAGPGSDWRRRGEKRSPLRIQRAWQRPAPHWMGMAKAWSGSRKVVACPTAARQRHPTSSGGAELLLRPDFRLTGVATVFMKPLQ